MQPLFFLFRSDVFLRRSKGNVLIRGKRDDFPALGTQHIVYAAHEKLLVAAMLQIRLRRGFKQFSVTKIIGTAYGLRADNGLFNCSAYAAGTIKTNIAVVWTVRDEGEKCAVELISSGFGAIVIKRMGNKSVVAVVEQNCCR